MKPMFSMCTELPKRCGFKILKAHLISALLIGIANAYLGYIIYRHVFKNCQFQWNVAAVVISLTVTALFALIIHIRIYAKKQMETLAKMQINETECYFSACKNMQKMSDWVLEEKHNLKNTAIGLLACLEKGDETAIAQARNILQELVGTCQNFSPVVWCENPAINAILNTKTTDARLHGVQIESHVKIENFTAPNQLICLILGNALDNAIEACSEIPQTYKLVRVQILEHNKNLFIQICNQFVGERKLIGGFPISSKKDSQRHGFGLRSMQRMIEEWGGRINVELHENEFRLNIILYGCPHGKTASEHYPGKF